MLSQNDLKSFMCESCNSYPEFCNVLGSLCVYLYYGKNS